MDLATKAYLISVGTVELQDSAPQGAASTAGPSAGEGSVFFSSGERTVRLTLAPSPLKLLREGNEHVIVERGRVVARGHLVEPLLHCPGQAYITVSESCIYDCRFCAVPKLMGPTKSKERVIEMVRRAAMTGRLKAISLTSGVEISPEHEVERIADIAQALRTFGVPIGISVCPTERSNEILRSAGAIEVKYNLETLDPDIFQTVCPGLSFEGIKISLADAVGVFGRNSVFTNVIVGLGESDRVLLQGIDELTEMGVMPVLRAVYPHPLRLADLEMRRPSPGRILRLAEHLRRALDRNCLRGDAPQTMCYPCTGCDLIPHRDL
ncbi:MAG: radical SAM protein [Methanothrix sp.]|uniref:radical SAM protein n=1 Tax=Methanothrix sp. TaxID=90426 RepID=UPI0025DB4C90|nr:radical SAM protein [Methanothrix sp.]MCQ8903953.1 radical SAM protein [Methanothrix sp.]